MNRFLAPALVGLLTLSANAQEAVEPKPGSLIIYGEGFSFSVKEPNGWTGDIDKAPEYHSNIIFHPAGEDPSGSALVQVSLFRKQDEKTQDDLAFDVRSYEQEHPNLQKEDFIATHKDYSVFAKLVFAKNEFYQYIVYVNAGKEYDRGFSVAMNVQKRRASGAELAAFREIIASLWMLGLK